MLLFDWMKKIDDFYAYAMNIDMVEAIRNDIQNGFFLNNHRSLMMFLLMRMNN